MAWEDRKNGRLLVFPGGKRKSLNEEPIITAARET